MKKLLLSLAGAGLVLSLAAPANAVTISWVARAFDREARDAGLSFTIEGGLPSHVAIPALPGPFVGGELNHAALQFQYQTSGAPYHVSLVEYQANGATTFVTVLPGIEGNQPITIPSTLGGSPILSHATGYFVGASGTFGNGISTAYAEGDFAEGPAGSMFTYTQINNGAGDMDGQAAGLGPNSAFPYNGNNITAFNGSSVHVVFTRNAGANPALPLTLDSISQLGVQNPPPPYGYGPGQSPYTFNFLQTGGAVNVELVPEPGSAAMLLALGVSGGSLLALRRRR